VNGAYICIGNSDDKLPQERWASFIGDVDRAVGQVGAWKGGQVHGRWFSAPDAPWQNAVWCLQLPDDQLIVMALKGHLAHARCRVQPGFDRLDGRRDPAHRAAVDRAHIAGLRLRHQRGRAEVRGPAVPGRIVNLPPWPVDEQSLELLHRAVRPPEDAQRSSLGDICRMFSELAGADLNAIEMDPWLQGIKVFRDPEYHPTDIIAALVEEIWRLRGRATT
jgi:hypothetical protein